MEFIPVLPCLSSLKWRNYSANCSLLLRHLQDLSGPRKHIFTRQSLGPDPTSDFSKDTDCPGLTSSGRALALEVRRWV